MNITNGLCMMCHEKSNTRYIDQLKRIDRLLHGVEPTEKSLRIGCGRAFLWDIHIRCQYGMDCPELERRLSEAKKEAREAGITGRDRCRGLPAFRESSRNGTET